MYLTFGANYCGVRRSAYYATYSATISIHSLTVSTSEIYLNFLLVFSVPDPILLITIITMLLLFPVVFNDLLWVACAAISITSSRYILCDLGLHYPTYLLILQLSATLVVSVVRLALNTYSTHQKLWLLDTRRDYYSSLARSCILTLAGFFVLQAILHTRNLLSIAIGSVSI